MNSKIRNQKTQNHFKYMNVRDILYEDKPLYISYTYPRSRNKRNEPNIYIPCRFHRNDELFYN